MSHNLFTGGESCLNVHGCWPIEVVAADGWGDRGNFLKQVNNEVCCINWLSWMISLYLALVLFDSILFTIECPSKLESVLSNSVPVLSTKLIQYCKSFAVISTVFTVSSAGADPISRKHSLCSSIRSNPSSFKFLSWEYSNLVTSLGYNSNSSSLAISGTSAVIPCTEVLNLSKSSTRVEINLFQTSVSVDILTSSHESWMFLMVCRMVNPSRRFSTYFARFIRGIIIYGSYSLIKCIS